jgi:CheY-like chemotaxis protein
MVPAGMLAYRLRLRDILVAAVEYYDDHGQPGPHPTFFQFPADPLLRGKKVLIVDDDVRNVFAVTALLEAHGLTAVYAENGRRGLELLATTPGVDLVLMDVMMPELDGYDTIRIMRQLEAHKDLPIIAITAKAMKGDREKCIDAGASDYLAKPVNTEQLLSLLRVWISQSNPATPGMVS